MNDYTGETGTEFLEGFFLFAAALWIILALVAGAMVMMGQSRVSPDMAASNQTPVAAPAIQ